MLIVENAQKMKKTIFLLTLALLCGTTHLLAQTKISGEVREEGEPKTKLANAVAMLLQARDSVLVGFARADGNGKFTLQRPDTAAHLLVVSYPKFGDFVQEITGEGDTDLGRIGLTSVANILEEVLVTGKIPVVIKGDTIEYDASSFAVEKNAKVEDLLKVLPGITVGADGKITAHGKTVEKVLVDGEEFFGDDPTLVTRNIRSDMVDKVQVYEKKSEEAERTGVDDGQRVQTIDLKLKEDAKKGMFGKAEAASGTDGLYLGKLAANKFSGSQKIAAYAMGANDGNLSLDWRESEKFGMGGMDIGMGDGGGMYITINSDGFDRWDGRGRPKAFSTGASFLDNWRDGRHKLNGNYKYGIVQNEVGQQTLSSNSLPGGRELRTSNGSDRETDTRRHRFAAKYDLKIDSLTQLTVNLSASKGKSETDERTKAVSTNETGGRENDNDRRENVLSENENLTYNGHLTRKFRKAGRSLSFVLGGNTGDDSGTGFLYSDLNVYKADGTADSETIDQRKEMERKASAVRTALTYTEPIIGSKLNASIGYELNSSRSHAVDNSYNRDGNGRYADRDGDFSSDFGFNTTRNAANLAFAYKLEKFEVNLTNNLRQDDMRQRNNDLGNDVRRDFLTYNPSLRLRYNITKNRTVHFSYRHANSLPSLGQIRPLRQNRDRLNIAVGNENLGPSRSEHYGAAYYNYNMMKGTHLYVNTDFSQTRDAIRQNVRVDNGVRTLFYENLAGHTDNSASFWLGGGLDLSKKHKIQGRISGYGNYGNYFNYINGELNENTDVNYHFGLNIAKSTTKGLDFDLGVRPGRRVMRASLNEAANSAGFVFHSSLWYAWKIAGKWRLYGDLDYDYEAPTRALADKFERVQFKPGVSRKFLKSEGLSVDFYVNDLFRQNTGFRRYQSGSAITQQTYNTISRYFMLKISWDFTTMN